MVELFKTNVKSENQARLMLDILSKKFPQCRINFDPSDCDEMLRVESESIQVHQIMDLFTEHNIRCEVFP